jgi:protein TonB
MEPLGKKPEPQGEGHAGRGRRIDAFLISSDDEFLIEIGPAFADRFRTRPVDDFAAIDAPADGARWLIVVDAVSQSEARTGVAKLEQKHGRAPIIVVARDGEESQWSAAVARGAVIDALPRSALQGPRFAQALGKAEARLQSQTEAPATSRSRGGPAAATVPLLPIIAGVLLLAVLGVWLLWRHPDGSSGAVKVHGRAHAAGTVTAPARATTPAASKPLSVLELLSAARVAFGDQKMLLPRSDGEPRGDSALELYSQVLSQEPKNDEALDGLKRLWSMGRARIQADIAAGKLDEAGRLLANFKVAGVDAEALREMEVTAAAARPKWLATRAQESIAAGDYAGAEQLIDQLAASSAERSAVQELRRTLENRKADVQLTALAGEVKAAIEAGILLDPANDNARTRLQSMRQVNRSSPVTLAAQRDLQAALLARAQDATRKQQFDVAQRYITATTEIGATPEAVEAKHALQAEIDASAQRAAAAAAAAAEKPAPESASADTHVPATAPSAAPAFIAARSTQPIVAQYPPAAADAHVRGYVIVEFTLQPDGRASNASVVEAQPAKYFEANAVSAVLHGRFDTSQLIDKQPRRARIKLSFKP